jgi:glutaconyl-CoA/methylmalonyl-CoA decarboxylase subunit gamma
MKYTVRSGRHKHVVDVSQPVEDLSTAGTHFEVPLDKDILSLEILEVDARGDIRRMRVGGRVYHVATAADDAGAVGRVFLNGVPYPVEITQVEATRYRPPPAERNVSGDVTASLPGQILSVLVSPGESVRKGQPLIVLEAMKMENEILAPKNGTLQRLHVRPGEVVRGGALLAEID